MEVFIRDEELPKKTCENCPLCEHFEKDAHGKGKHEVACLYEGTFNNILFGDKLCPENCNIIKSLDQHDAEVRNKVINELLEWADSKIMDWINSPNYREPQFRGTRIIHYCDLKQKLTELLTPNKKGEKDE